MTASRTVRSFKPRYANHSYRRILLKGENITLIQNLSQ